VKTYKKRKLKELKAYNYKRIWYCVTNIKKVFAFSNVLEIANKVSEIRYLKLNKFDIEYLLNVIENPSLFKILFVSSFQIFQCMNF